MMVAGSMRSGLPLKIDASMAAGGGTMALELDGEVLTELVQVRDALIDNVPSELDNVPNELTDAEEDEDEDEKQARAAIIANARRLTGRKSLGEVAGALRALGSAGVTSAASARKAKVDELFAAGKLAPVDREWAMSASEQEFSGYVKAMGKTQIVPVGVAHKPATAPAGQAGGDELTEAEKALQKASGLKKADIIAARTATYTAEAGKDD